MGLTWAVVINLLIVHHPPWGPIMLGLNEHAGAPGSGSVDWDPSDNSQAFITIQACLHICLPMSGYRSRGVHCHGFGCLVNEQSEGRAVFHEGKWLVLANVKCTGGVAVQDELF